MLGVGLDEPGEATIDAIAFADIGSTKFIERGYDALDQICARIFLKVDQNEDRILSPKDA